MCACSSYKNSQLDIDVAECHDRYSVQLTERAAVHAPGACDQSMGLQELQQLLAAHQIADAALHSSSPVQVL
jgi:hypothetical protein